MPYQSLVWFQDMHNFAFIRVRRSDRKPVFAGHGCGGRKALHHSFDFAQCRFALPPPPTFHPALLNLQSLVSPRLSGKMASSHHLVSRRSELGLTATSEHFYFYSRSLPSHLDFLAKRLSAPAICRPVNDIEIPSQRHLRYLQS
jgi:hypothetical protein